MNQHADALYKALHSLLESATKFALVVCISVLALAYLIIVCANPHDQQVIIGVKESWGAVSLLIVGFYFGQKGLPAARSPDIVQTQTTTLPASKEE